MNSIYKVILPLIVAVGVLLILLVPVLFLKDEEPGEREKLQVLYVNERPVFTEVVTGREEQERGLGGRDSLPIDQGLLFSFGRPDLYPFWMKDMRFPIDIIWMDADLTVVDLAQNVAPDSYPEILRPKAPASFVLELTAGSAERYGVKIGDRFRF